MGSGPAQFKFRLVVFIKRISETRVFPFNNLLPKVRTGHHTALVLSSYIIYIMLNRLRLSIKLLPA